MCLKFHDVRMNVHTKQPALTTTYLNMTVCCKLRLRYEHVWKKERSGYTHREKF